MPATNGSIGFVCFHHNQILSAVVVILKAKALCSAFRKLCSSCRSDRQGLRPGQDCFAAISPHLLNLTQSSCRGSSIQCNELARQYAVFVINHNRPRTVEGVSTVVTLLQKRHTRCYTDPTRCWSLAAIVLAGGSALESSRMITTRRPSHLLSLSVDASAAAEPIANHRAHSECYSFLLAIFLPTCRSHYWTVNSLKHVLDVRETEKQCPASIRTSDKHKQELGGGSTRLVG